MVHPIKTLPGPGIRCQNSACLIQIVTKNNRSTDARLSLLHTVLDCQFPMPKTLIQTVGRKASLPTNTTLQ